MSPLENGEEPVRSGGYRTNVVLILYAFVVILMVGMMFVLPDFAFESLSNIFIIFVLSVILVYLDAGRIGAGRSATGWGWIRPVWWLALMVFIWIIAFPLYLIKRKDIFSGFPVNETGQYEEFSRADVIGSFFIPLASPMAGTILALYYAYRGKIIYFAAVVLLVLVCWAFDIVLPKDYFLNE